MTLVTQAETAYVMLGSLFVLLVIGVPIAFSLAASGLIGLFLAKGANAFMFLAASYPYSAVANLAFIIIPLFLFMGHMAFAGGLSARAFEAARRLVGQASGGLAIATIMACAAFATVSGSSVATAATMARIAIPEMLKAGYSQRLAAGCVSAGGTLGVLIPPSGILVIYSIATGVSVAQLLVAAIIPGFFTAAFYAIGIYVMARFSQDGDKLVETRTYSVHEKLGALKMSWEALVLFGVVMGSMYLGVATPTEAAGVGAFVALLLALWRCKNGRLQMMSEGLTEAGRSTAAIFALIIGSGFFSLGLGTTQLPQTLVSWVGGLELSSTVLLIIILIPFLILGAFIDGISMILLTMPIVFPIVQDAGINPILFGILVTKMTEIGAMTPPVGMNAFVIHGTMPSVRLSEIYRGSAPFVIMELMIISILIAFPAMTLTLVGG